MDKSSCLPKEPFIKLGAGEAPTLDYNLPQETCFSVYGRRRVPIDAKSFLKSASEEPKEHHWKRLPTLETQGLRDQVVLKLEAGLPLTGIVRNPKLVAGIPFSVKATTTAEPVAPERLRTLSSAGVSVSPQASGSKTLIQKGAAFDVDLLVTSLNNGYLPTVCKSFGGAPRVRMYRQPKKPVARIFVIEEYKVCSYLGDYGAGKTVKTFTLLPGEKTTIAVSSYFDREETAASSENILDSFSQSAADSFEQTLQEESGQSSSSTDTESETDTDTFGGGLTLGLDLGIVDIGAGGEGASENTSEESSSTTRDNYVKNINNAVEKHATTSNSSREVEVNTTTSETVTTGETSSTTRELQNINHSRVLNFVFRQLLQEYVTITYLKDVRFVFTNGYPESTRTVEIPDLPAFLKTVIVPDKVKEVFGHLMKPYCKVYNYQGTRMSFIEQVVEDYGDCPFAEPGEKIRYWRKRRDLTDSYEGFSVNGIILNTQQTVLRTDSLVVDSLLGQGEALDCYNQNLQAAAVDKAELDNQKTVKALAIVDASADAAAKSEAYANVFGVCCETEPEAETE